MRNLVKKAAVTALVCVTAAGMMAGCGNKNEAAKTDDGQEAWCCKSCGTHAAGTG